MRVDGLFRNVREPSFYFCVIFYVYQTQKKIEGELIEKRNEDFDLLIQQKKKLV
jgi:hypothetical protein